MEAEKWVFISSRLLFYVYGGEGRKSVVSPLPCSWPACSMTRTRVPNTVLWTHTQGQGAQTLWVSFPPSKRGGKNTSMICELPGC